MRPFLYAHHWLSLDPQVVPEVSRRAEFAASLLLSDCVTLARTGTATNVELQLPSRNALEQWAVSTLGAVGADETMDPLKPFFLDSLTLEDAALLAYALYEHRFGKALTSCKELIDEGVLDYVLTLNDPSESSSAVSADRSMNDLSRDAYVALFSDSLEQLTTVADEAVGVSLTHSDGIPLSALRHLQWLGERATDFRRSRDPAFKLALLRHAYAIETFLQSTSAELHHGPVLTLVPEHASARRAVTELLRRFRPEVGARATTEQDRSVAELSVGIFGYTLTRLPTIIPPSAEALLETRDFLATELDDLKAALRTIALDALDASAAAEYSSIQDLANRRLLAPLRALELRLAHPSREWMRNMLRSSATTGIVVTAALSHWAQFPPAAQLVASLLSIPIGAALQTAADRRKDVDNSGLQFLLHSRAI
jgi:hypothetical protein